MEHPPDGIRIVAINGSVRPRNYTGMALALVVDEFKKEAGITVTVIDPASLNLPFPGTNANSGSTKALQEEVKTATGVILATPEYHGSFSSVMNLGFPSVLSAKPVALLGVAAGSIGAIKSLEHLRGVCSHIGAMVPPLPVSVANVQKVLDNEGRCLDPSAEKLIRTVATNLINYLRRRVCPAVTLERILRAGSVLGEVG